MRFEPRMTTGMVASPADGSPPGQDGFVPGGHVCLISEVDPIRGAGERLAGGVPFVRMGLGRAAGCLVIAGPEAVEALYRTLGIVGIDVAQARESGALSSIESRDGFLGNGAFDPGRLIALVADAAGRAAESGFTRLRLLQDMTWVAGPDPDPGRLQRYETGLDEFLQGASALSLCQYHRQSSNPEALRVAIRTHPLVITGGVVARNFYHLGRAYGRAHGAGDVEGREEGRDEGRDEGREQVDRLLANLEERARLEDAMRSYEVILDRLKRVYALLALTNRAIVRAQGMAELFQATCQAAVESRTFLMAWIGMVDEGTGMIRPVASAGIEEGYLKTIQVAVRDAPESRGPTGTAVREGRPDVCNDIAADPRMAPWREQALLRGYRASGAFPLLREGTAIGSFTVYSVEPGYFDGETISVLEDLAGDISLAMTSFEYRARGARERAGGDDA